MNPRRTTLRPSDCKVSCLAPRNFHPRTLQGQGATETISPQHLCRGRTPHDQSCLPASVCPGSRRWGEDLLLLKRRKRLALEIRKHRDKNARFVRLFAASFDDKIVNWEIGHEFHKRYDGHTPITSRSGEL
ncbi:hypothetical protein OS493_005237 [Desmophyllum pertusum]|uniref:Uncharacterized protein n=1 Tax=Desmophyllum pertusum TaxID=174260 RepID=A0A9W9Z5R8_9CNID|nr:hypothetical protein OS493_005237 [Desmophyllum pertusum]